MARSLVLMLSIVAATLVACGDPCETLAKVDCSKSSDKTSCERIKGMSADKDKDRCSGALDMASVKSARGK